MHVCVHACECVYVCVCAPAYVWMRERAHVPSAEFMRPLNFIGEGWTNWKGETHLKLCYHKQTWHQRRTDTNTSCPFVSSSVHISVCAACFCVDYWLIHSSAWWLIESHYYCIISVLAKNKLHNRTNLLCDLAWKYKTTASAIWRMRACVCTCVFELSVHCPLCNNCVHVLAHQLSFITSC